MNDKAKAAVKKMKTTVRKMNEGTLNFRIRHASDDRTSIIEAPLSSRSINRTRNVDIYARRGNRSDATEPTIQSIYQSLKNNNIIGIVRNSRRPVLFRIGRCRYLISIHKEGARYAINGEKCNVEIILKAIARTIMRAAYLDGEGEEAQEALDDYLNRCIDIPENVAYAMENRVPYHFFERTEDEIIQHLTRMNLMQIDTNKFAIEISSGVWGEIGTKELNSLVDAYLIGRKRSKRWSNLPPAKLYFQTMDVKPTLAQVKVMKEFLKQNRKPEGAEKRAMELFENMCRDYPEITKGQHNGVLAMFVRGKYADWMIVDNQSKRGIQDVSTYVLTTGNAGEGQVTPFSHPIVNKTDNIVKWAGPICIDNLSNGATKGDQFAARAFACKNDSMLLKLVSTVSRYIKHHEENQQDIRLDWDAMCELSSEAPDIKS